MAEWLRRQTWNLLGFPRVGSNPAQSVLFLFFFYFFYYIKKDTVFKKLPNSCRIALKCYNSWLFLVISLEAFLFLCVCDFFFDRKALNVFLLWMIYFKNGNYLVITVIIKIFVNILDFLWYFISCGEIRVCIINF